MSAPFGPSGPRRDEGFRRDDGYRGRDEGGFRRDDGGGFRRDDGGFRRDDGYRRDDDRREEHAQDSRDTQLARRLAGLLGIGEDAWRQVSEEDQDTDPGQQAVEEAALVHELLHGGRDHPDGQCRRQHLDQQE